MSDEEIKVPCVQKTIALIYETFKGVTREGGVSWSRVVVPDDYKSWESMYPNGTPDTDKNWEELADDTNWDHSPGVGGFGYLDPISFRYYLPAAMIKELRNQPGSCYFSLRLSKGLREQELRQWSALAPVEIQCVCEFLKCMDTLELERYAEKHALDDTYVTSWLRDYHSHWVKFDANPMP